MHKNNLDHIWSLFLCTTYDWLCDIFCALAFNDFREAGFVNAIEDGTPTNISPSNLDGSETYDNIWVKQSGRADRQEYTGRSGEYIYL